MEQLCIFQKNNNRSGADWKLYIDGASRNNPGPSGAGIVIYRSDQLIEKNGFFLGSKTNNQAEYLALLIGIFFAKSLMQAEDRLHIISDSQLLVRQLRGQYRVKHPGLKLCFSLAKHLLEEVSCTVEHVLRDQNKEADAMANKGIDTQNPIPKDFQALLVQHKIFF